MSNLAFANWVIFFPLAVTIFIATRITAASMGSNDRSLLNGAIQLVVKLMLGLSVVGVCCRNSMSSAVWLLLASGSLIVIAIKNRELKRSAFLLTLFHCAHQPEQVREIAEKFYNENQGWLQRRCRRLLQVLSRISDWGIAIEIANLVRGPRNTLALRLLSRLGKAGMVRRTIISGEQFEYLIESLLGKILTCIFTVWGLTVIVFIEVYIVPSFERLILEMNVPFPAHLQWFSQNTALVNSLVVIAVFLATIMSGIAVILYLFPNARTFGPQRLLFRSYFRALSFEALAETCQGNANLVAGIRHVAALHPVPAECAKLLNAANNIDAGVPVGSAFRKARLASSQEAKRMDMSLHHCALASLFSQFGASRFDRCLSWYTNLVQFALVALVLMLATVVGSLAYALMEVLADLIDATSKI